MSSLLKDLYSPLFYEKLANVLNTILPNFNKPHFISQIYSPEFEAKELKERMSHTANVLHQFLPEDYAKAISIIKKIINELRNRGIGEDGLAYMFLPNYIEIYGVNHLEESIEALEFTTQFVSCEYAVRPFILKFEAKMMAEMQKWSTHKNFKVRRFASEGCRPRLPWAMGIPNLKKDTSAILPILENLKNDSSEFVRKSVANNLNDISKDHPETVLNIAKKWAGISPETDAIIKHGCRSLLKQGHVEILKHYGLDDTNIHLSHFKILTPEVEIGESLEFSFSLLNDNIFDQNVRLEYAIYYKKQNGQNTKKVYKISERIYPAKAKIDIIRKQKFILITTRKFHLGNHQISIIINGSEKEIAHFELVG
ncbi:DNA alkylation repair protein [Pedobacter mucosus]|uniref:DNA alkylation repair protein n=1 Tax=Pedobacter mucosus TaxID=2895286 RepID=UPI001EE3B554|nr:DNA alkylation repair protein [Pedobacter mucosus]UKT62614.1 DNA alkylation repair protein [Pedobacter mucosus]